MIKLFLMVVFGLAFSSFSFAQEVMNDPDLYKPVLNQPEETHEETFMREQLDIKTTQSSIAMQSLGAESLNTGSLPAESSSTENLSMESSNTASLPTQSPDVNLNATESPAPQQAAPAKKLT